ncbi:MAG: hypothetical protein WC121_10765 [Candidatus Kapaibacterium sp.]
MATYRQDETEDEYGYGPLTISYIFSDTWDGLFASESYAINVIEPDKLKFKREQKIGQLALDEFKFKVSEAVFSKDDSTLVDDPKTQLDIEQEFLNLCLTTDKGSLFYVGVFFNSGSTPDISEAKYLGAVNSKSSFDDLYWPGDGEYGVTPTPVREYSFECLPSEEAIFDEFKLSEIVAAIDPTWESTFVFNGAGFYKEDPVFIDPLETRIPRLTHLHGLLNKLADVYEGLLLAGGYGVWSFTYKVSKIDGKFSPVRWGRAFESKLYGPIIGGKLTKNGTTEYDYNRSGTKIYDDEARELHVCGSYIPDSAYKVPYISYSVVKPATNYPPDFRIEYNSTSAEEEQWQNIDRVDDTFTGLLYSLATDLGMSLNFEFTAQRSVQIEFVSKATKASNSKIYIRDVIKASGELYDAETRDANRKILGSIGYLLSEPMTPAPTYDGSYGIPFCAIVNQLDPHVAKNSYPKDAFDPPRGASKNIVSIGASVWDTHGDIKLNTSGLNTIIPRLSANNVVVLKETQIPYNLYLSDSSGNRFVWDKVIGNSVPYNSTSFSNQLYMLVDKRVGETNSPASYFTQVGRLEIKEEGVDKYYYSLADFVNGTNTKDQEKYGTKYKLDIPYLMCASTSPTGTSPSIFNLGIDKIIEIDGLDFIIDDYEVDLQKRSIKLELSAIGRFDYGAAAGREDLGIAGLSIPAEVDDSPEVISGLTLRNSGIKDGEWVSRISATEVERTAPLEAHYGRLLGVARHDADEDDQLIVQTSGDVLISWLSGSVNDAVFVKKVSATENLSTTPITTKTVDEDLYAEVGKMVDTNIMRIGIKEHFVIE